MYCKVPSLIMRKLKALLLVSCLFYYAHLFSLIATQSLHLDACRADRSLQLQPHWAVANPRSKPDHASNNSRQRPSLVSLGYRDLSLSWRSTFAYVTKVTDKMYSILTRVCTEHGGGKSTIQIPSVHGCRGTLGGDNLVTVAVNSCVKL